MEIDKENENEQNASNQDNNINNPQEKLFRNTIALQHAEKEKNYQQ